MRIRSKTRLLREISNLLNSRKKEKEGEGKAENS